MKKLIILAIAAVGLLACKGQNEPVAKDGTLSGKFSVSPTTQVQFSRGNLQYQASTQTWRFAENQYEVLLMSNEKISPNYEGWIDLFGWGSGNNPTNNSTDNNDYSIFTDWGVNAISNGGNKANLWRSLTNDEWAYLFYTRASAAFLFGLGNVYGINGTIILPDNWSTPQGATFTPSITRGLVDKGDYYYNNKDREANNYLDNTYTAEQWSIMESAGAVFLPCGGFRRATSVTVESDKDGRCRIGNYWSTIPINENRAYNLCFNPYSLYPQGYAARDYGVSIRLVKDVQ